MKKYLIKNLKSDEEVWKIYPREDYYKRATFGETLKGYFEKNILDYATGTDGDGILKIEGTNIELEYSTDIATAYLYFEEIDEKSEKIENATIIDEELFEKLRKKTYSYWYLKERLLEAQEKFKDRFEMYKRNKCRPKFAEMKAKDFYEIWENYSELTNACQYFLNALES